MRVKADKVENCEKNKNEISERQICHEERKMIKFSFLDCSLVYDYNDPWVTKDWHNEDNTIKKTVENHRDQRKLLTKCHSS